MRVTCVSVVVVMGVRGSVWSGACVKAPVNSVCESGSVHENWLAFIHDPLDVGLRVAVKLNDGSVEFLLSELSFQAVFKV